MGSSPSVSEHQKQNNQTDWKVELLEKLRHKMYSCKIRN